jgi:hypothetical protein
MTSRRACSPVSNLRARTCCRCPDQELALAVVVRTKSSHLLSVSGPRTHTHKHTHTHTHTGEGYCLDSWNIPPNDNPRLLGPSWFSIVVKLPGHWHLGRSFKRMPSPVPSQQWKTRMGPISGGQHWVGCIGESTQLPRSKHTHTHTQAIKHTLTPTVKHSNTHTHKTNPCCLKSVLEMKTHTHKQSNTHPHTQAIKHTPTLKHTHPHTSNQTHTQW